MKRYYAFFLFALFSSLSFGQVSFTIFEPESIAGGYEFTSNGDGPNWGLPNLEDPADAVTDTVVIADDGTPGINAQGIPHANEACEPLINDVEGKIVLLYRYDGESDNDCYAGTKVLNAQNAGAVGVILVNRDNSVYGYNGTDDGPFTSIPFAFVTKDDGALIREQIEAGEDVIAFIGNKLGLYDNDAGIINRSTVAPTLTATNTQTALNASEFGFDVGTTVYNYGATTQSNIMVTATVTGPAGEWTQTSGPLEIETGDSIQIYAGEGEEFPYFSFDSYPAGTYTLTYNVDLGVSDESDFDNSLSFNFVMNDSMVSYCKIDPETNEFSQNRSSRSGTALFSPCMVYDNQNGSRLGAEGLYFIAETAWNVDFPLAGELAEVVLYEWQDEFVDMDDPDFSAAGLTIIADAEYIFGEGEESELTYAPFDTPVLLGDNQRYLACVQIFNPNIWVGYSSQIDYTQNVMDYRQPMVPTLVDETFFALGFGEEMVPTMALRVLNAEELSIDEEITKQSTVKLYPNPANDQLTVVFTGKEGFSTESMQITDLSGRVVRKVTTSELNNTIDVSNLKAGQYILTIKKNGANEHHKFFKL